MSDASPVFIIGTERSGSNLLRLILNQHPAIAIPHPPHILKEMVPLEPLYGDLSVDANFKKLVADVVRLVRWHFFPWDAPIDPDAVFSEAPGRDVYGIKAALYDQYRRAKGKSRWGCKSTFVIEHVDRVRRIHPRVRFVHLVRDGRDVAASAKRSVFNHFHPHYVGRLWSRQQRAAIELAARLPPENFLSVRYEDLLRDPRQTVRRVCGFIGEDYSDSLLDYSNDAAAKRLAETSRSWENCAKPVLQENHSKYRAALSADEIWAFERQAFQELTHYKYTMENDAARLRSAAERPLSSAETLRFWCVEHALWARESASSLFHDRNAILRARKSLFVKILRLSLKLRRPRAQRDSEAP